MAIINIIIQVITFLTAKQLTINELFFFEYYMTNWWLDINPFLFTFAMNRTAATPVRTLMLPGIVFCNNTHIIICTWQHSLLVTSF